MTEREIELVKRAVADLRGLDEGPEEDHADAERILCRFLRDLGYPMVAEAFEEARKKGGWWYA